MQKKLCVALFFISFFSFAKSTHIENQYNTLTNLFTGDYSSQLSVKEAKKDKNNLGVGAAAGLGELIVLNGKYYVADAQGNAKIMKPNDGISYLTATHFNTNQALEFQIKKPMTLQQIQELILKKYHLKNSLYASKIIGKFQYVHARNEDRVFHKVPLNQWLKNHQHEFSLADTKATIVSFYTPLSMTNLKGISVQPLHNHFITPEMKMGHVLSAKILSGHVYVQKLSDVKVYNPKNGNLSKNIDQKEVAQLETSSN